MALVPGTPKPKEPKPELSTYAFRVKVKQTLEEFKDAIDRYKKVGYVVHGMATKPARTLVNPRHVCTQLMRL